MSDKPCVLVVEDQKGERDALARLLRMEQYEVVTAGDPQEALRFVQRHVGVVVSDLRLGHRNGVDLLREWRTQRPDTPFIMVTAYADVGSAVASMKLGADDYLTKPIDPNQLLTLVGKAMGQSRHPRGSVATAGAAVRGRFERMIGTSAAQNEMLEVARRLADSDSSVLLIGELGTGKEFLAQAIHHASRRQQGPFVGLSAAAVPQDQLLHTLFGWIDQSAANQGQVHSGRIAQADQGTLFIDEICDLDLTLQARLLRTLDEGHVFPIGHDQRRSADIRLIAATSRELAPLVAAGTFREDLLYRLQVGVLRLPPLRERADDIIPMVEHFLAEICRDNRRAKPVLTPALSDYLARFSWPGNLRQLRHAIESMAVQTNAEQLDVTDLPHWLQLSASEAEASPSRYSPGPLHELEKSAVLESLERFQNNRTHAAAALGISVRTLQRKLKSWGLNQQED